MNGLMMKHPLLVSELLRHAKRHHGDREIVSRRAEGDIHRCTYRDLDSRARRVAKALRALGVGVGDRVGTLAWNGYRHMELYFAVSGMGAVLHTLNPRLHPDQLAWIACDARDHVLCFDITFLPLIQAVAARLPGVRHFVLMSGRAHMPDLHTSIPRLLCYEDLCSAQDDDYAWPQFDENHASSLCYTSGTTGNPKGVLYSHRSTVLHTMAGALPDVLNLSACEVVLPVVPMFHANAWGLPYMTCMVGAKLVFPGPALDGKSLYELCEDEGVTLAAGVPTVWQGLLEHVDANDLRFSSMRRTVIGGSACPPSMLTAFEHRHGVEVLHAWGMTELSPIGTACAVKPEVSTLHSEERRAVKAKQGRALFGIDMKIVDLDGDELPWDGQSAGELMVRGHWVVERYTSEDDPCIDGWFPTGDMSTIDRLGYMQVTDRAKDVIKSGGEWISSIDIENIATDHPQVAMAACIGVPHPKWDERPLLVVVPNSGTAPERDDLLRHFKDKVVRWWIPDDVVFVDAIPLGPTGKMQKNRLREQFKHFFMSSGDRAK